MLLRSSLSNLRGVALPWAEAGVLDPHAGTGTTALAAEEAERVWTLFDDTDAYRDNFERRRDGKGDPDPPPMSLSRRRESAGHGHA